MKTKKQKNEDFEVLRKKLPDSKITVFTSFAQTGKTGLTVAQIRELRQALREEGGEYLVSKKTLLRRALNSLNLSDVNPRDFDGSSGVVLGYEDPIATARSVYNFSKKNNALVVYGALFEGAFIDKSRFMELANLPSREVLLSRVVGMMNYPMTGMVNVLQGNIKNLLLLLKNIKK